MVNAKKTNVRKKVTRRKPKLTFRTDGGYPTQLYTKMVYSDSGLLTQTTAGTPSVQQYRLASIFDPDITNIGHQPYGHDSWQARYETYQVIKCLVEMEVEVNTNVPAICWRSDNTSAVPSNFQLEMERPGAVSKIVAVGKKVFFRKMFHINTVYEMSKKAYIGQADYITAFGANPTATTQSGGTATLNVSFEACDNTVTTILNYKLKMTFYCALGSRLVMGQS